MKSCKLKFKKNAIYSNSKKVKYLDIGLTKHGHDPYAKHYKTLMKQINEDLIKIHVYSLIQISCCSAIFLSFKKYKWIIARIIACFIKEK